MIYSEPLPLLEAHFFLANRQFGASVRKLKEGVDTRSRKSKFDMDRYFDILSELEARLESSITVEEDELVKLYSPLDNVSAEPYLPVGFFIANILVGEIRHLSLADGCFERIRNEITNIGSRIVYHILGESSEMPPDQPKLIEVIMGSTLSNENKLLLIDLILHPDNYYDMLERTIAPIAEEFERCDELIAPLLEIYENDLRGVKTRSDEREFFARILKKSLDTVENYSIHPLVTYFDKIIFAFEDEGKGIFGGMGVIYNIMEANATNDLSYELASVMNILGSKSRFDILICLLDGPKYGRELAASLSLTSATVSHHINALLSTGFIKLESDGARVYYSVNYDAMDDFIANMSKLFARPDKQNA